MWLTDQQHQMQLPEFNKKAGSQAPPRSTASKLAF